MRWGYWTWRPDNVVGLNKMNSPLKGLIFYQNNCKGINMIIIAFSNKTSKIIPRIFCGKIKHVAPILVNKNELVLYQFINHNNVVKIKIKMRDIYILKKNGWRFLFLCGDLDTNINKKRFFTCVQMTKIMLNINDWKIQTPAALFEKLMYL